MEIIVEATPDLQADRAAAILVDELVRKPDLVLGLATGRTPVGLYERLRKRPELFPRVHFFNLDEFYGLPPSDPASFHRFFHQHLLDHVPHDPRRVHLFRGDQADLEAQSRDVEDLLRELGGLDVQILGIGKNGHVGFNEPGSSLGSRTRPKTLEPETLAYYAASLGPRVTLSRFAITMGVGTIMEARRLLMLATGAEKAEIVRQMVEGPVTSEVPASALQMHARATTVLDEGAASRLKRRDYYKWVFENKWRVGQ